MLRINATPRSDWQQQAQAYGFKFHTLYGEPYWDESAFYQFTLEQIENDIETPTAEIHQMCLHAVEHMISNEALLTKCAIPEAAWEAIAQSWQRQDPSLYSRLDFAYDGISPAKLLENNADTPTSLYETGFWQWLWLEQQVESGQLVRHADQFNSVQEKLVARFKEIKYLSSADTMHFSCCKDTEEDRGTVQYLQDCAVEAGIAAPFIFIEEIGITPEQVLTDLDDHAITDCFKLYPWEFMLRESFSIAVYAQHTQWLEPLWKACLSNKGLLAILWELFPNHPNLLPAYFADDAAQMGLSGKWIKKPLLSREGANISLIEDHEESVLSDGPYGEEGFVIQKWASLPKFENNYTLVGSWLIDDQPAGMSIREDASSITQDTSRFLPHAIIG